MGAVTMGPPPELTLMLQRQFGLDTFVEAGTYQGATARWAADHFRQVVTIEAAESLHQQAVRSHGATSNIRFLLADSRRGLLEVAPSLSRPALFWLDSHWCGSTSFGHDDQCPLLSELEILADCPIEHFVMIDDARLFLSPPPHPNEATQWPDVQAVFGGLGRLRGAPRYLVVADDVIVSVPSSARSALQSFCQTLATERWQQSAPTLRNGLRTMLQGARRSVRAATQHLAATRNR
jgi:hypothetical protein